MSAENHTTPCPAKTQLVYFIQCGTDGPIKIGYTSNFIHRFMTIQIANHQEVRLLGAMRGTMKDEKRLHAEFSEIRVRGEWFRPTDSLMEFIRSLPTDLLDSLMVLWGDCVCCGKPAHDKREIAEGRFAAYCRRCAMDQDGRLAKFSSLAIRCVGRKTSRPCMNCGKSVTVTRKGRCQTCSEYLRRNGIERPLTRNMAGNCRNCGVYSEKTTKGRCKPCYSYWNVVKRERPDHLWDANRFPDFVPKAKVTRHQASEIIERFNAGERCTRLAIDHQISPRAVRDILQGKTWRDIPRPEGFRYQVRGYRRRKVEAVSGKLPAQAWLF
jgi:hypothetical protein